MRSIPAMAPVPASEAAYIKKFEINNDNLWWDLRLPHYAFCHAQALADRDGRRRRVWRDHFMWRIEVADVG